MFTICVVTMWVTFIAMIYRDARKTSATSLELHDIWRLANQWCPRKPGWMHLLEHWDSWGPSHELGHALIEPKERRQQESYGRCAPGFCECDGEECDVHEIAAMLVSRALVTAAGHPKLANREINETSDYDLIATPTNYRRAKALLRRKRLWPVPKTVPRLEAALRRRLPRRVPVAQRKKRAKRMPFQPLQMFANELFRSLS